MAERKGTQVALGLWSGWRWMEKGVASDMSLTPDRQGAGKGACASITQPEPEGRGRLPLRGVCAHRARPELYTAGQRGYLG